MWRHGEIEIEVRGQWPKTSCFNGLPGTAKLLRFIIIANILMLFVNYGHGFKYRYRDH